MKHTQRPTKLCSVLFASNRRSKANIQSEVTDFAASNVKRDQEHQRERL